MDYTVRVGYEYTVKSVILSKINLGGLKKRDEMKWYGDSGGGHKSSLCLGQTPLLYDLLGYELCPVKL